MVGTKATPEEAHTYLRKVRKPMIEKRRRERMNKSIDHLKDLIGDTIKQNIAPMTRVDKADILELAVTHLAQLQQRHVTMTTETAGYSNGYKDCARETVSFLSSNTSVDRSTICELNNHLQTVYLLRSRKGTSTQHHMASGVKFSTPLRSQYYVNSTFMPAHVHGYSPIVQSSQTSSDASVLTEYTNSYNTCESSLNSSTNTDGKSRSLNHMEYSSSSSCGDENSDLVTIGDGKENAVGHIIKDTMWRPW